MMTKADINILHLVNESINFGAANKDLKNSVIGMTLNNAPHSGMPLLRTIALNRRHKCLRTHIND
jgi:hypothetical protein